MKLTISLFVVLFISNFTLAQEYWQEPFGPYGGTINEFCADSNNTLYTATWGNCLYKTTNNGDDWIHLNIPTFPSRPTIAWCIAAKSNGLVIYGADDDIWRSQDGGNIWEACGFGPVKNASSIVIYPDGSLIAAIADTGIFRSTDDGVTWINILNTLTIPSNGFGKIVITPNGNIIVGTGGEGIYKTTNLGNTWLTANNGLLASYIREITVSNDGTLYCLDGSNIYKSTNDGEVWSIVFTAPPYSSSLSCIKAVGEQDVYVGILGGGEIIHTTNSGIDWSYELIDEEINGVNTFFENSGFIYIGCWRSRGIYRTSDNGTNWEKKNNGLTNAYVSSIYLKNNGLMLCGSETGLIFRSTDLGNTFETKYMSGSFDSRIKMTQNGDFINAVGGIYRSSNDGDTWNFVGSPSPWEDCQVAYELPNGEIYAVSGSHGIFKTTDNGYTWISANQGLITFSGLYYDLLGNERGDLLLTIDSKLYRWSNTNNIWSSLGNYGGILYFDGNDTIYTFRGLESLYRSLDGGNNWEPFNTNLHITANSLIKLPNNTFFAGSYIGVYIRTAEDTSWIRLLDDDEPGDITALAFDSVGYVYSARLDKSIRKSVEKYIDVQFTEQTSISLIDVKKGSVAWGDYDNDSDLDILITGLTGSTTISKIYKNNGNEDFVEQSSIQLTGVYESSAVWGDYDNDDDLDILLTGLAGTTPVSKVYKNNDGIFYEQSSIQLTGVYNSAVAWGDYDNDGELDILLTGLTGTSQVSKIYKNNGGGYFVEQTSINLDGVYSSSVAWGDYDDDGDLDILITGLTGFEPVYPVTNIYTNNGDGTFFKEGYYLHWVGSSSAAWGDYDSDGDLDILLTGYDGLEPLSSVSKIFRNNGNSTFTEQSLIYLLGVGSSSACWGDYDNDGDLDILLTGENTYSNALIFKIYRNDGDNIFTELTSLSLTGVSKGSIALGDYDNDEDLDILLIGTAADDTPITKIYRNNNLISNTLPQAPTNLTSVINEQSVTLSWNRGTDNETPQNGLTYNLMIGTSPGALDKLSPMSDRITGYRRIVSLGNINQDTSWTIKELPAGTYYWSVQAIDNNYTGSLFSYEETFTIFNSPPIWTDWMHSLVVEFPGGTLGTEIKFGQKPNATNGLDPIYGEFELPPIVSGQFDARFILPTIPEIGSYTDIRDTSETIVTWKMRFYPGSYGYPMIINWAPSSLPYGSFYLTDTLDGNLINVSMRSQSNFLIPDSSIQFLKIRFNRSEITQLSVLIKSGWNIVSIPGLHPVNQSVNTWWELRDPASIVYKFSGGYIPVTSVTPTEGYWMKHIGENEYNSGDEWPSTGLQLVQHDPIEAMAGWNLIGGYENIVATSGLTTTPPGLIGGPVYEYFGGYNVATNLQPGYGYWIKLTSAGKIVIPETLVEDNVAKFFNKNWGKIIFTDAAGINYTLYAVKEKVNLDWYELPPLPPQGMFDIRYNSNRIAEDINSSIKAIDMSGVTYPLTVRVEGMDIRLMDESGKMVNTNLKSGEDVVISDATIQKLKVSRELLPTVYSLEQNYPNPFNPSTTIEFSLPEEVKNVKLSIYNVLGEKVAELVNTSLLAGNYKFQWNAQNVATGMYIYELRTDKFVSIKKMVLLK